MTKYRNVLSKLGGSPSLTDGGLKSTLISYETGKEKLERALQVARQKEMHDYVACCYINLVFFCMQSRQYPEAQRWLEEGLEYTMTRDLDLYSVYLLGWEARMCFA